MKVVVHENCKCCYSGIAYERLDEAIQAADRSACPAWVKDSKTGETLHISEAIKNNLEKCLARS